MGKPSHGATAESQSKTAGAKLMQRTHQDPLYPAPLDRLTPDQPKDFAAEMARLTALPRRYETISSAAFHKVGRNRLTRSIDTTLEFIRRFLPPIHWGAVRFL